MVVSIDKEFTLNYIRVDKVLPSVWCSGCGNGIVEGALIRAIHKLELNKDKVVVISGIGCSSRMAGYLDFNTFHSTHGRALSVATGVKFANPEFTVIVITGDGDGLAIGGNHFIHSCRRNIDITTIVVNNATYGMTGGQAAPTLGIGEKSTTSIYGSIEPPFDVVEISLGAGASFVARATTYHVSLLENIIVKAIKHKGFAVVDVISQCPVYYGRLNKLGGPVDMMNLFKEKAVQLEKYNSLSEEERKEKFPIGYFRQEIRAEYCESYENLIKKVMGER